MGARGAGWIGPRRARACRVNDLKRDIAMDRYEIDAGAVAAAILAKLDLIRRGREALLPTEAGRSPKPRVAPRQPR